MEPDHAPDRREAHRADELLPEEQAAGSDDPRAQATELLAESDQRQNEGGDPGGDGEGVEHRRSEEIVAPVDDQ